MRSILSFLLLNGGRESDVLDVLQLLLTLARSGTSKHQALLAHFDELDGPRVLLQVISLSSSGRYNRKHRLDGAEVPCVFLLDTMSKQPRMPYNVNGRHRFQSYAQQRKSSREVSPARLVSQRYPLSQYAFLSRAGPHLLCAAVGVLPRLEGHHQVARLQPRRHFLPALGEIGVYCLLSKPYLVSGALCEVTFVCAHINRPLGSFGLLSSFTLTCAYVPALRSRSR